MNRRFTGRSRLSLNLPRNPRATSLNQSRCQTLGSVLTAEDPVSCRIVARSPTGIKIRYNIFWKGRAQRPQPCRVRLDLRVRIRRSTSKSRKRVSFWQAEYDSACRCRTLCVFYTQILRAHISSLNSERLSVSFFVLGSIVEEIEKIRRNLLRHSSTILKKGNSKQHGIR
jgi:hypothetical protein